MNPRILHHKAVMIPRASIIFDSEVSITVLFLLCSPHYTAVQINNCSKSTSVIKVATIKNTIMPHAPFIIWNWSIHFPSLSAIFNLLHSSTNQELLKQHRCNQGNHYEKYGWFPLRTEGSHRHAITKSTLFTVGKDEWNTKEGTGKSMKNALHILQYAKRHLSGWSDVEQWKNHSRSLSCYRVTLVWRHQADRQAVS